MSVCVCVFVFWFFSFFSFRLRGQLLENVRVVYNYNKLVNLPSGLFSSQFAVSLAWLTSGGCVVESGSMILWLFTWSDNTQYSGLVSFQLISIWLRLSAKTAASNADSGLCAQTKSLSIVNHQLH